MKRLLPITILAACTLVALANKQLIKKAAKRSVTTHQKKASGVKSGTMIIKFNPDSVQNAPEGVIANEQEYSLVHSQTALFIDLLIT